MSALFYKQSSFQCWHWPQTCQLTTTGWRFVGHLWCNDIYHCNTEGKLRQSTNKPPTTQINRSHIRSRLSMFDNLPRIHPVITLYVYTHDRKQEKNVKMWFPLSIKLIDTTGTQAAHCQLPVSSWRDALTSQPLCVFHRQLLLGLASTVVAAMKVFLLVICVLAFNVIDSSEKQNNLHHLTRNLPRARLGWKCSHNFQLCCRINEAPPGLCLIEPLFEWKWCTDVIQVKEVVTGYDSEQLKSANTSLNIATCNMSAWPADNINNRNNGTITPPCMTTYCYGCY